MNQKLQDFARSELKKGLAKCTEEECGMFRRMYSHDDLEASMDEVVDRMPDEKLDWAMQQVERTIQKR